MAGLEVSYLKETILLHHGTSRSSVSDMVSEQDQAAELGPLPGGGENRLKRIESEEGEERLAGLVPESEKLTF